MSHTPRVLESRTWTPYRFENHYQPGNELLPIFSDRIKEIKLRIPGIPEPLQYHQICSRGLSDFHFDETMVNQSKEPFRNNQKNSAKMVKSKIISTLMNLVVQEKIDKESFQ